MDIAASNTGAGGESLRRVRRKGFEKEMKNIQKVSLLICLLPAMLFVAGPRMSAQTNNEPPFDFSDTFYQDNGLDLNNLNKVIAGRFGTFRQFGPPATNPHQPNWVVSPTTNPDRRDVRILATTGGYSDNGTGGGNQYINIIAFLTTDLDFIGTVQPSGAAADQASYSRTVGFIDGGLEGVQQSPGETIVWNQGTDPVETNPNGSSLTTGLNKRGISVIDIIGNFEAYAALKQFVPRAGVLAPIPCGTMAITGTSNGNPDNPLPRGTVCFPVSLGERTPQGVISADVATPNLRHDWRFATNRNSIDGSDNNCIDVSTDPATGVPFCGSPGDATYSDSPYGYFCDDLLGMWIITYFWYTDNSIGDLTVNPPIRPNSTCLEMLASLAMKNGTSLDGTPIIKTPDELNYLEGQVLTDGNNPIPGFSGTAPPPVPCTEEGNEDISGADSPAAVWLVCPAIPDPTNGAITSDAFLDHVTFANGTAVDPNIVANFNCLQQHGLYLAANGTCTSQTPVPASPF